MPRPRQRDIPLPNRIKPDALPPYVYWDASGHGRWLLYQYDKATRRTKTKRLAGPTATVKEIWDAYQAYQTPPSDTLAGLVKTFQESRTWQELSHNTQRDYQICAASLCNQTTKDGDKVGDTRLSDWTPGAVRKLIDRRAETSVSRANHELRFLRRLFAWAYERDLMTRNPGQGVKTIPEDPRSRYVTDEEYEALLRFATPKYPYLYPVCELAYLCRLRISEVCDAKKDDADAEGFYAARRKGSKDALTGLTTRLQDALDAALGLHGDHTSDYLIPGKGGGRLSESTIQTAWQRIMTEWAKQGHPRFTIHDLKRKGISDVEGDKLAASGHRSMSMLRVYDVLPAKAPATR